MFLLYLCFKLFKNNLIYSIIHLYIFIFIFLYNNPTNHSQCLFIIR